jgi:hypothetical protein
VPLARNHFVTMTIDSAGFATVDLRTADARVVVPVPPRVGRGDFGDSPAVAIVRRSDPTR